MSIRLRPSTLVFFVTACLSGLAHPARAQSDAPPPRVRVEVDRPAIRLGDPAVLTAGIDLPAGSLPTIAPLWPDSLEHFEWITPLRSDTQLVGGLHRVSFSRSFTGFDSGRWVIPPIGFTVAGKKALGDTIGVEVTTVEPTGRGYHDIGDILEAEASPGSTPWAYFLIPLLALAFVVAVWLIRRRRMPVAPLSGRASAGDFESCMVELDALLEAGIPDPSDPRAFHAGMYGVLRGYLARAKGLEVSSATTGDLLASVRLLCSDPLQTTRLASALRLSDAVRFARHVPPADESVEALEHIRSFIRFLHESRRPL